MDHPDFSQLKPGLLVPRQQEPAAT